MFSADKKVWRATAIILACAVALVAVIVLAYSAAHSSDDVPGSTTTSAVAASDASASGKVALEGATSAEATGTSDNAGSSSEASSQQSDTTSAEQEDAAASVATMQDIPRMPEVGMSEALIDKTELGAHSGTHTILRGEYKGGILYKWNAKNGTNDTVFSATVMNGKVQSVLKLNTYKDYWYDGTATGKDFPDLYAEGKRMKSVRGISGSSSSGSSSGASANKSSSIGTEDPLDYDSPEEYADNAEDDYRAAGSDDPWQDAYNDWESEAG